MWHAILVISLALLVGAVVILAVVLTFLLPVIQGAPFVASDLKKVGKMIELAGLRPGERLADLGSGDGRIVLAAAANGHPACGFEINPVLVWWSRCRARRRGLDGRAHFLCSSFWKEDLAGFDAISVFGIDHMMPRLRRKLERELKPGTRVISNGFSIPGWEPVRRDGQVFLYIMGNHC